MNWKILNLIIGLFLLQPQVTQQAKIENINHNLDQTNVLQNRQLYITVPHDLDPSDPTSRSLLYADYSMNVVQLTVQLDASRSSNKSSTITLYRWYLQEGVMKQGQKINYTYAKDGPKTITLMIFDNMSASSNVTKMFTLVKIDTVASFTITTQNGTFVGFNAQASTHPRGTNITYSWDWGDGTYGRQADNQRYPYHVYAKSGTYVVVLTVTDTLGNSSVMGMPVFVTGPLPNPSISVTTNRQTVVFDGSGSTDPDGTIVAYDWIFDDGTFASGVKVKHTFNYSSGNRWVTLRLTDDKGGQKNSTSYFSFSSSTGFTGAKDEGIVTQITNPNKTYVHIESLKKYTTGIGVQYAFADVTVYDRSGQPVQGVYLQGTLSSTKLQVWEASNGLTDAQGKVTLKSSAGIQNIGNFTVCIWNLRKLYTWYDKDANKVKFCLPQ